MTSRIVLLNDSNDEQPAPCDNEFHAFIHSVPNKKLSYRRETALQPV